MATATTSLARAETPLEQEGASKLMGILKKYQKTFQGVLPKHLTPERWAWLCINSIRRTPALCQTTPASFINAVLQASNLGLEIRDRSAYLVPFKEECTLIIDYRSKIDLARRSGKVGPIALKLVYEADEFDYAAGTSGEEWTHRPLLLQKREGKLVPISAAQRGEVVAGYSLAYLIGDERPQIDIMTIEEIEGIRKRAKGAQRNMSLAEIREKAKNIDAIPYKQRTPWLTDWHQMARKTLAHRGANYWPQSPELALSQQIDDAEAEGKTMPIAPELEEFMMQLDPADNRPMVEIPETAEDRRAEQVKIAEAKIAAAKTESAPLDITDDDLPPILRGDDDAPVGPTPVTSASFNDDELRLVLPYLADKGCDSEKSRNEFFNNWTEGKTELLAVALMASRKRAKK